MAQQVFIYQVYSGFTGPVYFQSSFQYFVSYIVGSFLIQSEDVIIKSKLLYAKLSLMISNFINYPCRTLTSKLVAENRF